MKKLGRFAKHKNYGPTINDINRLPYNALYRLGKIYNQSSVINYKSNIFWSPFDET